MIVDAVGVSVAFALAGRGGERTVPLVHDRPRAIVAKGKVEVAQGVDRMTDWQRAVRWSALAPLRPGDLRPVVADSAT